MNVKELIVRLKAEAEQFNQGLSNAKQSMKNFGTGMKNTGMAATTAFTVPIVAGAAVIGTLANDAINYQNQMNEVFTLLPNASEEAMGQMSDDVLQFAKDMGVIPEEVAPALYQAISAGVPADNVFAFLETAQKAAVGGVTDLETAVDGISTVVNAFGDDEIDAAGASDLMFTAVRLGKTTFEELAASLFQTLPTASALGVGFDDVTAAMTTMTAQGVPTNVATTQMRQLLVELSKEGGQAANTFEELAGQSFKEFIAEGNNVSDALALMQEHAGNTDVNINDLFGSVEAGNAALALGGENAQAYIDNIDEMQGAADATDDAFQQMESGVARQMEKLKAEFEAAKIEIGDKFLPIITDTLVPIFREQVMPIVEKVADFIGNLAEKFAELDPKTQTIILGALGIVAALGPVLVIAGMMVTAISALISPVTLVIAAIVGLIAIGVYLYQNWDEIKAKAAEIWNGIKDYFAQVGDGIKTKFIETWNSIKAFFSNIWQSIRDIGSGKAGELFDAIQEKFEAIFSFIKDIWNAVFDFYGEIWEAIKALFRGDLDAVGEHLRGAYGGMFDFIREVWGNILSYFGEVWTNIKTAISTKTQEIVTNTKTKFGEIWDYIKSIPAQALQWGKDILNNLWQGMKNVFSGIASWFQNNVVDLINKLNPWARHSPSLIDNIRSGVQEIGSIYRSMKLPEAVFQPALAGPQMVQPPQLSPVMATPKGGGQRTSETHLTIDMDGLFAGANISIGTEEQAREVAREIFRMAKGRALSEGVSI